ncbi:MAG: MgtC/SapB family protein [Brevundimonas sp.]|nr:MAG: MgtC/SapB family protein [Brevundimonas sp.]
MELNDLPGFTLPLLAAVLAGGLIGFEREWRGRAAGFRTHILVCLASALLMEAAVMQGAWRFAPLPGTEIVSDPARLAHGVLTGIGFLCAGVIFRSGFSIHGLTTAASLWVTAAIGLLFGAGLYGLGGVGTALTVAILVVLRLVSARLPQTSIVDASILWRRDAPDAEAAVEAALSHLPRQPRADHHQLVDDGARVKLSVRLQKVTPDQVRALALRLRGVDGVVGYELDPRDD